MGELPVLPLMAALLTDRSHTKAPRSLHRGRIENSSKKPTHLSKDGHRWFLDSSGFHSKLKISHAKDTIQKESKSTLVLGGKGSQIPDTNYTDKNIFDNSY